MDLPIRTIDRDQSGTPLAHPWSNMTSNLSKFVVASLALVLFGACSKSDRRITLKPGSRTDANIGIKGKTIEGTGPDKLLDLQVLVRNLKNQKNTIAQYATLGIELRTTPKSENERETTLKNTLLLAQVLNSTEFNALNSLSPQYIYKPLPSLVDSIELFQGLALDGSGAQKRALVPKGFKEVAGAGRPDQTLVIKNRAYFVEGTQRTATRIQLAENGGNTHRYSVEVKPADFSIMIREWRELGNFVICEKTHNIRIMITSELRYGPGAAKGDISLHLPLANVLVKHTAVDETFKDLVAQSLSQAKTNTPSDKRSSQSNRIITVQVGSRTLEAIYSPIRSQKLENVQCAGAAKPKTPAPAAGEEESSEEDTGTKP
jgi:hypothetical protein